VDDGIAAVGVTGWTEEKLDSAKGEIRERRFPRPWSC